MGTDSTYTRRVCAVLLADVTGFSRMMGEDDEGTARAVQHLQAIAQEIISDANGRSEPVAGDALFATFDSVVAAVQAAIAIQRRIAAEDFEGRSLRIRIGVHVGDVLTREGRAFGDAINIAARLESRAQPGTICVSDGVYRQVHNRFDEQFVDLGRQQLKNISDPIHAYLIVPTGTAHARRRPALRWAIGAGVLVAAAGGVIVAVRQLAPSRPAERVRVAAPAPEPGARRSLGAADDEKKADGPIVLGVMLFKSPSRDAEDDWRREAIRDGLNTQLSQLSRVKVYSKEFLDFLVTRKGLTEIEAASQLGIMKMLSGSFVASGGVLRIETHVVDVASGVMEASYTTSGNEQQFLDLQNQLALGVIARLNLPASDAEKQALLAQRNTDEDALKLLLEAEGGGASPPSGQGPHSRLWRRLLGPAAAYAESSGAEDAIHAVLERYRQAMESRQLDGLASVYTEFTDEQRAAQERYFQNIKDLKVVIDNVDIAVVGDEAVVSYTRTDDFLDVRTGRPMHVAVRLTKTLKQDHGGWKLAGK